MTAITLNIDGKTVKAEKGQTVLQAALNAGIYIPNLCYHPDLKPFGGCRMCLVEIEKMRGFPTACTTYAEEGMKVKTNTKKIEDMRRISMELILANHPGDCLKCSQNLNCELQAVAQYIGIDEKRLDRLKRREKFPPTNTDNPLYDIDIKKCILCGRCVRACNDLRGASVLSFVKRGRETYIGTAFDRAPAEANCIFCRACVEVCPTGALADKKHTADKEKREAILVPCRHKCPAGIDIPRYIRFITQGKYSEATAVIREKVPFPNVLGRVCFHPCEEVCLRKDVNEAMSINGLKRFCSEKDAGLWKQKHKILPSTGKRVAIIGSGPAGLTAAFYLAKKGHSVTIFESLPVIGGMTRVGIPEYRLPRDILDKDIEEIKKTGINIKTNTKVESLDELFSEGYNAIILAIGAFKGTKLGVDGETHVLEAIEFLRDVSLGKKVKVGKKAAVIGCGNVAIDAARTALRTGAKEVTILYRRTCEEAPASDEEIEAAKEEGVKFTFLTAPCKISRDKEPDSLKMECTLMELGAPDASGRPRPTPKRGSEFVNEFDTIIAAIGESPDVPAAYKVDTERDRVKISADCMTNREGVFGAGDAVTGPLSVIEAIAGGRRAAMAVDKYLGGDGNIEESLAPVEEPNPLIGMKEGFAAIPRGKRPSIPPKKRLSGFDEIEHGYDKEKALCEAARCLQCDLRLKISSVGMPPKKKSTKGRHSGI